MYRVDRNNFYEQQKKATIYTPDAVSRFIFNIVNSNIGKEKPVIDPCVGAGSLLKPFKDNGYTVIGIDIQHQGFEQTEVRNYLSCKKGELPDPSLVIINPPFNIDGKTKNYIKKHYGGRPLLPEVWLQKAIELFGIDIPIVLFTPYGLRLNQTVESKRWQRFIHREYPDITSIISLPKNIFDGILFHSEILIFNIPPTKDNDVKPHYFYH